MRLVIQTVGRWGRRRPAKESQTEQAIRLAGLIVQFPRHVVPSWGTLAVCSPRGAGSLRWQRKGEVMTEPGDVPRGARRRRRANVAGGRRHSHEVKVTAEEEAQLVQLADEQRVTVPRLLVESALAPQGETPSQRRELVAALFGTSRLLGTIANNVNQIAKATNATGEWQPETAATLEAVRRTVVRIEDTIDGLSGARARTAQP